MPERDVLETDVLVVGGGPAGLAAAIRFKDLLDAHNQKAGQKLEASIMVVEKGAEFGAHSLSGAVLDPVSLRELILSGELKSGERLSELTLVERLGVSRTPVRAALMRLSEEGLVASMPAGGFSVRAFT